MATSRLQQYTRTYSISSANDDVNIQNKRCPEYALNWTHGNNQQHWEPEHDYFLGNGENITDNAELRRILSEKLARGTLPKKLIFCDLDGVLADFEKGVVEYFGKRPDKIQAGYMWSQINKSNIFFETLPWMPRGRELWEQIKQYDPIILTGIPRSKKAAEQKRRWCARELGSEVHVITCSSKDKANYCLTSALLIDDRLDNLHTWNEKAGKFILYAEENMDNIIERIHTYMESEELCIN